MNDTKNDTKVAQKNPPKTLKIKTSTEKPVASPEMPCNLMIW